MSSLIAKQYKPRKPGLLDRKIALEKQARLQATYAARPEVKRDLMCIAYGGRPSTATGALLDAQWRDGDAAADASWNLRHTEHGDFSHLQAKGVTL